MSCARVKVGWMEGEELNAICIKVVVRGKGRDESTLCTLVYMMKSRVPRTLPWGTPQEEVRKNERMLSHLTATS